MKDNRQNNELQTRRDFFKKAARISLPIIGLVALNMIPFRVSANGYDCRSQCVGSCGAACTSCWTGCTGCKGNCRHNCEGGCKGGCREGCGRMANNPGWGTGW